MVHGRREPKKVFFPYMCDHVYALAAAMRAHDFSTEVLQPTTTESLGIGLHFCKGRECLPCLTTTGDILYRARQPDFNPAQAAIFMPTTSGSCRFGCYNVLQQTILQEEGLGDIEFMSPNGSDSYQSLGKNPTRLRLLIWQGAVAVDLLIKLLHEYRPYEVQKGQTDRVYKQSLEHAIAAIEAGGGRQLVEAMRWTARQFEMIEVDFSVRRPLIGIVGEIYLRLNPYVNMDIGRQVEALGGEAHIASIIEWLYYTNWTYIQTTRSLGMPFKYVKMYLTDAYQRHIEYSLVKPVAHLLKHPYESPINILMSNLKPYYDPSLTSEAILSMGAAIEFARRNCCGILNIMPFSCMPGIITAGMASRIRADLNNIPWLDISYDAQGGTNIKTRLEAFMYQASQFQRSMVGKEQPTGEHV